jgi:hypothetical protein
MQVFSPFADRYATLQDDSDRYATLHDDSARGRRSLSPVSAGSHVSAFGDDAAHRRSDPPVHAGEANEVRVSRSTPAAQPPGGRQGVAAAHGGTASPAPGAPDAPVFALTRGTAAKGPAGPAAPIPGLLTPLETDSSVRSKRRGRLGVLKPLPPPVVPALEAPGTRQQVLRHSASGGAAAHEVPGVSTVKVSGQFNERGFKAVPVSGMRGGGGGGTPERERER